MFKGFFFHLNMTFLSFFSSAREKTFARELVLRLVKELPPALVEDRRKVLSVNKVTRLLERTYREAKSFQQTHRLGFVKRAILANSFKWELKSSAYPDDFVDLATEGLVIEVSRATKSPDAKSR